MQLNPTLISAEMLKAIIRLLILSINMKMLGRSTKCGLDACMELWKWICLKQNDASFESIKIPCKMGDLRNQVIRVHVYCGIRYIPRKRNGRFKGRIKMSRRSISRQIVMHVNRTGKNGSLYERCFLDRQGNMLFLQSIL